MPRILLVWGLILSGAGVAKPTRFAVKDIVGRDLCVWTIDGPLEKTVALLSSVEGSFELDPDSLRNPVTGELRIDLRAPETGSTLRNEWFRSVVFSVSENSQMLISFTKLAAPGRTRLGEGQPLAARLEGTYTVRGVTRPLNVPVKLTYWKANEVTRQRLFGNLVRITGSFSVALAEVGLSAAALGKALGAANANVSLDFVGTDGAAPGLESSIKIDEAKTPSSPPPVSNPVSDSNTP